MSQPSVAEITLLFADGAAVTMSGSDIRIHSVPTDALLAQRAEAATAAWEALVAWSQPAEVQVQYTVTP